MPEPENPSVDLLQAWQACQAEIDAAEREFGVASREQIRRQDQASSCFQAMIAGELPAPPISQTLDFILPRPSTGRATFQGRPGLRHYNPMGTVHGGWFATLLDSALGCAVQSILPAGKAYTTAELKVNIVRPLTDKVPLVRAEANVIHGGGRMATAEGRLTGPDGKLYAHAPPPASSSTHHEIPAHHAARRRPAALDRFLHRRDGHEAAAHHRAARAEILARLRRLRHRTRSTPRSS